VPETTRSIDEGRPSDRIVSLCHFPDKTDPELERLIAEQRADDRNSIQHASDGRTATTRIGSQWVQSLPPDGHGGTTLLWPAWDEIQDGLHQAMDALLADLEPSERDLVLLRYGHRVPLREIGDITGCSKDTVSRELADLMAKLRRLIADETGASDYREARKALLRLVEEDQ
jgi:RNA polymerase sigma factor (sigma-70 family)